MVLCRALSHPLPHRHLGAWPLRKSRAKKSILVSFLSDSQGLGHSASKASSSALHFLKSLLLGGDAEENAEGGQRLGRSGPLSRRLGKGGFGGAIARGEAKTIPPGGELGRFFFWWGGKGLGGTPSRSARPLPLPFILQLTCTCPSTESRCPCWTGTTIEGPSACVRGKGKGPRQTIIGDRSGRERTRKRGQRTLKREMLAVCSLTPRRGTP